jgi:hypothetical protein
MNIEIKNRLEVKPGRHGGIIQIPGFEPTTNMTDTTLSINLRGKASIMNVRKALKLIPGSKLIREMKPLGHLASGWFFELPNGPPPYGEKCPRDCNPDWYQILRDNATIEEPEDEPGECAGFDYSGCPKNADLFLSTRDPNQRPNSQPLSNIF